MLASSASHVAGAAVAFAYNILLRQAVNVGAQSPSVMAAAKIYFLAATLIGAGAGLFFTRRIRRGEVGASLASLPAQRAAVSTICWLGSIPALTIFGVHVNGALNPVTYPHFVASVVIAWLISTAYSSLYNVQIVGGRRGGRRLMQFARILPLLAGAVPLVALTMFVFFVKPWSLPPVAVRHLNGLFVLLMTLGGYGALFCTRSVRRLSLKDS